MNGTGSGTSIDRPYVIASIIEKGGVGKTTKTIHLAAALARWGKRVLILDLDAQRNSSTWIGPAEEAPRSIYEVLQTPTASLEGTIVPTRVPGVDIIVSARAIGMAERLLSSDAEGNPRNPFGVVRQAVRQIPASYDVVFIDCPPTVGILNTNAIVAADRLLISLDPSEMTYDGFATLALTLQQMIRNELIAALPAMSILYNLWDPRLKGAKKVARMLDGATVKPYHIFKRYIRNRVALKSLPEEHITAFDSKEKSALEVAEDYDAVASELLELLPARVG